MMIFKYHHALSDGVGGILAMCSMQEDLKEKQMPVIRKYSTKELLIKYSAIILAPIFIVSETMKLNAAKNERVKLLNDSSA